MKVNEVPQDRGMINDKNLKEICYAVDDQGRYVLTPSGGWEPKNIANEQAWDLIREEVSATLFKIRNGKLSPLAYHMTKNQMTVGLLAKYMGMSRLRVWSHMKPWGYRRLRPEEIKRYADLFELTAEALKTVPEMEL